MRNDLDTFRRLPVPARRGMTIVELLVSLTIIATLSTSVAVLMTGAGHTNTFVYNQTNAVGQVENAYRRILHNLRTCSALTNPSTTTPTNTFTVSTQPDPSYGNVPATVTYSISGGNLVENDSRYGTSTLVTGVSSFSVTRLTTTSPIQVTITIISGTSPPVTRSATITCRNL